MRRLSLPVVIVFAWLCSSCTSLTDGIPTPAGDQTAERNLGKKVFDADSVEWGVSEILTEEYKIPDVQSVQCPANQPAKVGRTFECTVLIGGKSKKVKITPKSGDGEYEVGQPVG